MGTFLVREIIDGKMVGGPIEAGSREEAEKIFKKKLPALKKLAAELPETGLDDVEVPVPLAPREQPRLDKKLNGKKFLGLEFQCSGCGEILVAVFKDGYLQIDPCPTCLGELENMVAASKRFLERKK